MTRSFEASIFYPLWAYRAWFPLAAQLGIHFFLFLSQHTFRDAPPWGIWLRTLHWWRKVGRDRRNKKKKAQHPTVFEPKNFRLWGAGSTAVLQTWPFVHWTVELEFHLVSSFDGGSPSYFLFGEHYCVYQDTHLSTSWTRIATALTMRRQRSLLTAVS